MPPVGLDDGPVELRLVPVLQTGRDEDGEEFGDLEEVGPDVPVGLLDVLLEGRVRVVLGHRGLFLLGHRGVGRQVGDEG